MCVCVRGGVARGGTHMKVVYMCHPEFENGA